jgi:hypothetical protein
MRATNAKMDFEAFGVRDIELPRLRPGSRHVNGVLRFGIAQLQVLGRERAGDRGSAGMDLQLLEGVLEVLPNGVRRHDEERRDLLVRLTASHPGEDFGLSGRETVRVRLLAEVHVEPLLQRDEERSDELEQVAISLDEVSVCLPAADVEEPCDPRGAVSQRRSWCSIRSGSKAWL